MATVEFVPNKQTARLSAATQLVYGYLMGAMRGQEAHSETLAEIAEALGLSPGSVWGSVQRLRYRRLIRAGRDRTRRGSPLVYTRR